MSAFGGKADIVKCLLMTTKDSGRVAQSYMECASRGLGEKASRPKMNCD